METFLQFLRFYRLEDVEHVLCRFMTVFWRVLSDLPCLEARHIKNVEEQYGIICDSGSSRLSYQHRVGDVLAVERVHYRFDYVGTVLLHGIVAAAREICV